MASTYNYLTPFISDANTQELVTAAAVGLGLVTLGTVMTRRLRDSRGIAEAVVPSPRMSLFGVVDLCVESFVKFHDSILGKENRQHVPFTGTIFFLLLISNFLGLVPGMPAATTTVWVNVGLSLGVFLYFNYLGIKSNGIKGYLAHFAGGKDVLKGGILMVLLIAPFLFGVEVFSTFLRIVTLNLRLYWNIVADHMVLEIFTGMLGPVFPATLYVLGSFVSFMQAFIFTTLTMVYIQLATQHDEEHH